MDQYHDFDYNHAKNPRLRGIETDGRVREQGISGQKAHQLCKGTEKRWSLGPKETSAYTLKIFDRSLTLDLLSTHSVLQIVGFLIELLTKTTQGKRHGAVNVGMLKL